MIQRTIQLPQATLIAQHTGFAGSMLTASGSVSGKGGSGGSFSVYYSVTELRNVEITISVMSETHKGMAVVGIPKGKRKPRRFPTVATELHAPRSLVLRGWGLAAPPNPTRLRSNDSDPGQIGFTLSSADWNRRREQLFEQYMASVREVIVVDFPDGIGCEMLGA